MTKQPAPALFEEISRFLQYHDLLGIREYPRSRHLENFLQAKDVIAASVQGRKTLKLTREPSEEVGVKHVFDPGLARQVTLRDVREELGDCHRCSLHKTRSSIVFGQGDESADLMIIIDAPSREDDRQQAPVQGNAGELLDKMLAAIGLSRQGVYITSLVKCFPGEKGNPDPDAIKSCLPFLFRQIEIICPAVICTMGPLAARTLLHSKQSLFHLRGRFYNFNDLCRTELQRTITVMPSLHPLLLLKNADLKKASWQDLQLIQKRLAEG